MYTFEILSLEKLPPHEIEAFNKLQQPFTKSEPYPLDLADPQNRTLFAVGAKLGGEAVGLLLARMYYSKKIGEIISLFVSSFHRKKKIGTQLINELKKHIEVYNFQQTGLVYSTSVPETSVIEKFLKMNGFSAKKFTLAEFQFDYAQFKPKWFLKNYNWPPSYQVFPWYEIREEEIKKIKANYDNGIIPYDVYPFVGKGVFEPLNSLGLRYKGEIIGWIINERTQPDMINYKNIYIDFSFHSSGYAIVLLIESLKIQVKNRIKWGLFQININNSSARWLIFIRRRLAPYANYIYEYSNQSLFSNSPTSLKKLKTKFKL